MRCPICQNELRRREAEPGLTAWDCEAGHGRWFPSFQYWRWLAKESKRLRPCPEPGASTPAPDEPACPECGHGLKSSFAGRGLAYRVSRCEHCRGLWIDQAQCAELERKKLTHELESIFGTFQRRDDEKRPSGNQAGQQLLAENASETKFTQISKKKPFFPISKRLLDYLAHYGRACDLPPIYEELSDFSSAFPCMDQDGNDTLWQTVSYDQGRQRELSRHLSRIYSQLKTGDPTLIEHLDVERVDYCDFGNSKPFRVRVVNRFNDNYDHFYVKIPDASRVYGLELEHTLSPNRFNYLVHDDTLIEEHIAGIPGDVFIRDHFSSRRFNQVRVAKEFVKFNERCFIRLLGDMRSYNYVVDVTPDFEETQYRVRAIDFDQQSYEGDINIYLPQFYKENAGVRKLCTDLLNYQTMKQYQSEERSNLSRRVTVARTRLNALFSCMRVDEISTPEKVAQLAQGLCDYHKTNVFERCRSMGGLVRTNIDVTLAKTKYG